MTLAHKLAEERRARLAAERLLELKQAELFAANRKLGLHARKLSNEIVETRAEVATVRTENERFKSDLFMANQKIETAERRLWHSIETIQDGFAIFDADDRMICANPSYLVIFDELEEVAPGISYARLLQLITEEGIVDIGTTPPHDWRAAMLERWEKPNPEPTTIKLWNGQSIKLLDRRGSAGDVVTLALNITETVRYETELKAERQRAEAASRAKSSFLANMSHEIRTPMNGVVGMADLLTESPLTEEQELYVSTIKNSGEALLDIINDVLDFSKIEANKLVLHPAEFDLERCIHEIITLLQPSAREKGIHLLIDYDIMLPSRFVGDLGRIRQVLTNLLGNAVKFTPEGHVLVRVVGVDQNREAASFHVTIEDTGIGILDEKVDHIFGEFNQVDDERNREFEGTGLGLSITRKLIELMNGEIWVTSEQGDGSCFGFRLTLPFAEGAQTEPCPLPEGISNVLVVDDHELNRQILERQFSTMGATVTCARDGLEAQEVSSPDIDLVITDHNMPNCDGLELAQALRNKGIDKPILLLSSSPRFAENDPARPLVQAVLQKPVSRRDLFSRLANLQNAEPDPVVAPQRPAAVQRNGRRMRILAAEDNKTNQLVFRKLLKTLEIDLVFACNGIQAVDEYQKFSPDLIFMDISMPKMDGKEATSKIRDIENDTGHHVPIVALTAHALDGDEEGILAAGLDHYLTKPLRKPEIFERIADALPNEARDPFPVEETP